LVKIDNIELPDFPLLLAPMEDVSDPPFRALCKEQGADVVYTEFVSSEGLIRNAQKSVMKLDIYEKERPVGIQIFGANMDSMLETIDIVAASKPDVIDINFAIAIHGRTRAQMYKGNADWKPIAAVKNNPRMHIPIFGNGDVTSPDSTRF